MSTKPNPRKYHLERNLAAAAFHDRSMSSADSRRLCMFLSTWTHRSEVDVHDARVLALLGWDAARLESARLVLAQESQVWTVTTHPSTGAVRYLFNADVTTVPYPSGWGTTEAEMADWKRTIRQRAALKLAARRCLLTDSEDALVLMVLSATQDYRARRWSTWGEWEKTVTENIDVSASIERLVVKGYVEVGEPGTGSWRLSQAYIPVVAEAHSDLFDRSAHTDDLHEQEWLAAHGRTISEDGGEDNTHYFYLLVLPEGAPEHLGRPGDVIYVGTSRHPAIREHQHQSGKNSTHSNDSLKAIRETLRATPDGRGGVLGLRMVILKETMHTADTMAVALRERDLIQEYYTAGHPLCNIQHVTKHWLAAA